MREAKDLVNKLIIKCIRCNCNFEHFSRNKIQNNKKYCEECQLIRIQQKQKLAYRKRKKTNGKN